MKTTRNTIQRDLVLQAVMDLKDHPTPEEVYEYIHKKHPSVSKGTIYRNLNVLIVQGQLHKVDVPDGANRVDHRLEPHYHMECRKCRKVFDVDMPYIGDEIMHKIRDPHGFKVEGHNLIFLGICPDCNENV